MKRLQWERLDPWFASEDDALAYFLASFSHHGQPLRFNGEHTGRFRAAKDWWQAAGQRDPIDSFPKAFSEAGPPLPSAPEFQHRFAGLVMLADWLGSHAHWFPVEPVEPARRLPQMLRAVGLDPRTFPLEEAPFSVRFDFSPRPLQARMEHLDPRGKENRLLIAESETGSGKTEAALHWFAKLFAAGQVDGLYFALPTRVAARSLYQRVVDR